MSTLFSHCRAAQLTIVPVLFVIAFSAFHVLAADVAPVSVSDEVVPFDEYYAHLIAIEFGHVSAAPSQYSNTSIENSSFDWRQYIGHTCFRMTDHDRSFCEKLYGPYADLRQIMVDGTLLRILQNEGMFTPAQGVLLDTIMLELGLQKSYPTVPSSSSESSALSSSSVSSILVPEQVFSSSPASVLLDTPDVTRVLQDRAASIWTICMERYPSSSFAKNACFQRNHSLLLKAIPVAGNVY